MNQSDSEYYMAREQAELAIARASVNPAISGIHRELAARYARLNRAQALLDKPGGVDMATSEAPSADVRSAIFDGLTILIVEDDPSVASELAFTVAHLHARPIGLFATVTEALALLKTESVAAAILDANLRDREVTPLALHLVEKAVPFVIHTGTGLPAPLSACFPDLPVVLKPAVPATVLAALSQQILANLINKEAPIDATSEHPLIEIKPQIHATAV